NNTPNYFHFFDLKANVNANYIVKLLENNMLFSLGFDNPSVRDYDDILLPVLKALQTSKVDKLHVSIRNAGAYSNELAAALNANAHIKTVYLDFCEKDGHYNDDTPIIPALRHVEHLSVNVSGLDAKRMIKKIKAPL